MKIEKFKNKFIKINDVVCYISDIYPDLRKEKEFIIFSWIFINNISNYQKNGFLNRYQLIEKDLKECELLNFKGIIYYFKENHNYLGIDESKQYIYHCPKSTFAFSNSFCVEFDKKIDENKCISTYIEIENGVLKKQEIIEKLEKIENKIIDFISYKFDFNESKNIFLNSKSFSNDFNIRIEKKIKEIFNLEIFSNLGKDPSKRIHDVIEIIKFNIKKSDFVNALRSLRILRNSILDFIYDDYFIPISSELDLLLSRLECEKNNNINIPDESNKTIEKEIEEKIKKNIKKIYLSSKEYIKLAIKLVDEKQKYFSLPIYFMDTKFEDLDIENFKFQKKDSEIIDFIKNKILSKEEWKVWDLCSAITNNAIHKNNYDLENFEGWWIHKKEIEIILKIIETFFNALIKYNEYKMLDK